MTFAELTRQCDWCSSHIYIEDRKKDVIDETVDGRRHLYVYCPVCNERMEIKCKLVPKEEKEKK